MFNAEFVVPALLIGIFGGLNFKFNDTEDGFGTYLGIWAIQSVIYIFITGLIFWAGKPAIVAPYQAIFWFIALYWIIGLIVAGARMENFPTAGAIIWVVFFVIFIGVACSGCELFRYADYRGLIGDVEEGNWTEDMAPVDEAHMRVVSKEQAQYLADKVLGESQEVLGSRFKVGEVNVCNVKGEIVWVAPLEFRGFWKWNRFKSTVGYVLVSAEDNNRKPVLVDTLEMKYLPTAFWGSNLRRHVYTNGYQGYQLREISFELDDNYKPYFTISATAPTIGFGGAKTLGVIIVDPETGDIEWYGVGKAPDWVDRVIPEEIAESYMKSWGLYVKNYWNTIFSEEGIIVPTTYPYGSDVWFVPDASGRNYWYTGMTSSSSEDQALVGVMLMDTKTGVTRYYRISGSNEQAIIDAVTQSLGADAQKWQPTQPIPYPVYGEFSFLVPVVGIEKPILQKVALVRASNLNVAIGDDKRSALRQYQRILSSNGNIVAPTYQQEIKQIAGRVVRRGWELQDETMVFFLFLDNAPDKLFSITSTKNAEILVTEIGDRVELTFMDTDEEVVPVTDFNLVGIELQKSDIQAAYEAQVDESESSLRRLETSREDRRTLENLSPEELRELMNALESRE
ncbi:MAG: hypothetical protein ABIB97_04420 [Patescibacteria group bacterium]